MRKCGIRETITDQLARRKWTWLDHVLRMDYHSHPRIALTSVPEGKGTEVDRERDGEGQWKERLRPAD